jgi:RND superfamily putative drug exporter
MFEKLGKLIVNRWYLFLAIWILTIIVSAPLSSLFLKSVSYQVTISVPGSTSAEAEHIVAHYFNLSGAAGSGAVLIVQGNVSKYSMFFANLTSYDNISILNYYSIEKSLVNNLLNKIQPAVENLTNALQNISKLEGNLTVERENISTQLSRLEKLYNGTVEVQKEFENVSSLINSTEREVNELHYAMVENYTTFQKIHEGEIQLNQSAFNLSLFLYFPVSYFLEIWESAYSTTHNVTEANEIAYEKVSSALHGEELEYFNLFYSYWSSTDPLPNPINVAQNLVENASYKIFPNQTSLLKLFFDYVNLTNFRNTTNDEIFTVNYFTLYYKVPENLSYELLFNQPLQVLLTIYEHKTGIPENFLQQIYEGENLSIISLDLILSKVTNTSAKDFIVCVYNNISKSPYEFSVGYVSQKYNVSKELLTNLLASPSPLYYLTEILSNKTKLPQWFFISLYNQGNISNLTAYLISSHFPPFILQKNNITLPELTELLENNKDFREIAINLTVNAINVSPLLEVNKTLLITDLKNNYTVEEIVKSSEFPITFNENISRNLFSSNLLLIFMKGNFTYKEAEDFSSFVESKTELNVTLTGANPINHQLKGVASSAYSIAIPVGIALAIILAGLYFRSFAAAFMPLTIYISAYVVSSIFQYLIVIKLLKITVSFLTPSEVLLLALGLGTDYVVFISSRYVEEREKGLSVKDAVYEAVRWGGRAVTITAFIVMLSFLFIYIYKIPFFSDTAISDMLAVLIIWLASITLYPAILRVAGDKLFFPRRLGKVKEGGKKEGGKLIISKRPKLLVGILSAIVLVSVIFASFTPLTLNVLSLLPKSQAVYGVEFLSSKFTSANIFPIYVVIPYNGTFNQSTYNFAVNLYKQLSSIPGVTAVNSPVSPYGFLVNYTELKEYNYTQYVSHGYLLFIVNQKYQPFSLQAFNVVKDVLKIVGDKGYVGGGPVDSYNIYNFVTSNFFIIVGEIAVTMFLLLFIMTRSLSISAVIIYVIMSAVAITLALERLIFDTVLGYSIFAVVPIFLVAIIIGIGMDYNIFLIARVHEELEKGDNMEVAVEKAVKTLRLTIMFLGFIFAGTLGALMLVNAPILQELGFAFFIAAILETSVLWSLLAPPLLILLYRKFKTRPKLIV